MPGLPSLLTWYLTYSAEPLAPATDRCACSQGQQGAACGAAPSPGMGGPPQPGPQPHCPRLSAEDVIPRLLTTLLPAHALLGLCQLLLVGSPQPSAPCGCPRRPGPGRARLRFLASPQPYVCRQSKVSRGCTGLPRLLRDMSLDLSRLDLVLLCTQPFSELEAL